MTEIKTSEVIDMMNRCKHEITSLRRQIDYLQPKADAYDNLTAVLRLLPKPSIGMGEDLVWLLDKRIRELEPKEEVSATPALKEGGKETIICAAILLPTGIIASLERPARHGHILGRLGPVSILTGSDDQGFVTSTGRFVDRKEACTIAREAGQIRVKTGPSDILFSEDVW